MNYLYEIYDASNQKVVARITADNPVSALRKYRENGGALGVVYIPRGEGAAFSESVLAIYE
ncbi:hypothetical protein [Burkholderia sp. BC1]|uniref:hypothetical protein n=1 Tax=Burkholderia sp. BC1 TaxID=1095370 RepID=UPI004043ABFA